MEIKLLHLSDMHFSPEAKSETYSIEQLMQVENIYDKIQNEVERVIVTGDITCDHETNSIVKANSWLEMKILTSDGKSTGLGISRDKLKVVPGNLDFDFSEIKNKFKNPEEKYFSGLSAYNEMYKGSLNNFSHDHPLHYDWFKDDDGVGVFILYASTAILDEKVSDNRVKKKYVDYLCNKIRDIYHKGISGDLIYNKSNPSLKIDGDDYRKAFKIFVNHHSLMARNPKDLEHIDKNSNRIFLSNLGLMDFQMQLSGHRHEYFVGSKFFYKIFDKRAKNRYILNQLKLILGLHEPLPILTLNNGKPISRNIKSVFQIFVNLFDPDNLPNLYTGIHIEEEIQRIINGDPITLADQLNQLISRGIKKNKSEQSEWKSLETILRKLTKEQKDKLETNSKNALKIILSEIRQKEIVIFNAGSPSIPSLEKDDRHFNVIQIQTSGDIIVIVHHHYSWDGNKFVVNTPNNHFYTNRKIRNVV